MQTILDLLNRIHWDPEFGRGRFEIGYYDRLDRKIIRVPFNEVTQMPGDRFFFHIFDDDGIAHCIPMHRVREVYKDGELIWKREPDRQK
ncbi:MAG: DUF504 domain-containing protein [Desulfobulbales bacterium]|nr:DUF504 domain-containing protein [Desulfobulbales bacterium]